MGNRLRIEMVEGFRAILDISKSAFCKRCGISYSVYKKMLNHDLNFRVSALFKLAKVLKMNVCELFY